MAETRTHEGFGGGAYDDRSGTPAEHVHAVVAAAKQFGSYPIASDLDRRTFIEPEFLPFGEWMRKECLPV